MVHTLHRHARMDEREKCISKYAIGARQFNRDTVFLERDKLHEEVRKESARVARFLARLIGTILCTLERIIR